MKKFIFAVLISITISGLAASFFAQTKKAVKKNVKPTATPTPQVTPPSTPEIETTKTPTKKNERPTDGNSTKTNLVATKDAPNYFYEFTQPAFVVSKILIEHDENGKGKISFMKSISDELITDPLQVSPAAMERINAALTALNFIDSTENYQYEKDYSHLGNIKIRVKKDGREREAKFNWTVNKDAKALADEYRKIGNQCIWMFDMNLARENQPLESPKVMDLLDSYIRRDEVSDAAQLIPFLKELGNDERIPLIARNHATRLIAQIEKSDKK
jgi:hypothetical protein